MPGRTYGKITIWCEWLEMLPEGPTARIRSSRSFGLITEEGVQSRGGLSPQNFIREPLGPRKTSFSVPATATAGGFYALHSGVTTV